MAAILAELDLSAQAYCGYPMSLSQVKQLQWWFYEYEGMPVQKNRQTKKPTIGDEAVIRLLKLYEEHPLLTARATYAETQQTKSHYLDSLVDADGRVLPRIYPDYSIHAQTNGRCKCRAGPLLFHT
jgi:DNA polymerase I-like protein with 3'-5' exonuclease and polymerase domains